MGGGRGWQKTMAVIPAHLLPFTPAGTVETETLTLTKERIKLADLDNSHYLLTTGDVVPERGQILLNAAEGPLLIAGSYGRGQVIYSTLNLEDPPFKNTLNFESLWNYIIGQGTEGCSGYRATRKLGIFPLQQAWPWATETWSFFSAQAVPGPAILHHPGRADRC